MMNPLLKGSAPHCPPSLPLLPKGEPFTEHSGSYFQGFWLRLRCFIYVVNLLWLFLHRVPNLHSQASPVPRAPSMPPVETSYIPPPPPLIQDYRHYYHAASDLPGKPVTRLLPLVQFIATVISRWCGKKAQNEFVNIVCSRFSLSHRFKLLILPPGWQSGTLILTHQPSQYRHVSLV